MLLGKRIGKNHYIGKCTHKNHYAILNRTKGTYCFYHRWRHWGSLSW